MNKKLKEFVNKIKAPVAVIFHTDADGVCSAVIASKAIERITGFLVKQIPSTPGLVKVTKKLKRRLELGAFYTLVFVDLACDQEPKELVELSKGRHVLVIDHHPPTNDLNKLGILHINPKFSGDKRFYPASKLCFDLFKELVEIEDLNWVAAVGLIADSAAKEWKPFLARVNKKYKYSPWPKFESEFDQPLGEIGKWVNSARLEESTKGLLVAVKALYKSEGPECVLKLKTDEAKKLKEWSKKITGFVRFLVDEFETKKESTKDLDFYEIQGNSTGLKSTVATILGNKHRERTIFVFCSPEESEFVFFSCRRSDGRINLKEVIAKSTAGLKRAQGGGHAQASAGLVLKKDFGTFKKRIKELLT